MRFQPPRGTRDFYPADMALRNWIVEAWRRVSLRHGFEEYDGPIFEPLELYKAKSGDAIVSELFHFTGRGKTEYAIRPEMTPTLARMIGAQAQSLPRPIKWFSVPRLCRAERPQRGRLREFFQWNIDIVGTDDVLADAECIFVAVDFFREVGVGPQHMVMRINSRSLLSGLLVARGFAPDRHAGLFAVLDKRDKLPQAEFEEELARITRSADEKAALSGIGAARGASVFEELERMAAGSDAARGALNALRDLFRRLDTLGVTDYCELDLGVVRGLDYYTGVVFEGFGKGGFQRAICGGGRYDQLLEVLGGPPMSGVGFGTSDVVTLELLNEFGLVPPEAGRTRQLDFFVIDADPRLFDEVLGLVARLRQGGYGADFSYRRQTVGKQLKQADGRRARRAVIVGDEYTQRGVLSVKDLTTGTQVEIRRQDFLARPLG